MSTLSFKTLFNSGDVSGLINLFEEKMKEVVKDPSSLVVDVPLEHGPLAKNQDTIDLENLFRYIIRGGNIMMSSDSGGNIQVQIAEGGQVKVYNITEMMKHANLSHITLDDTDMNLYMEHIKKTKIVQPIKSHNDLSFPEEEYFRARDKANNLKNLTYAEILAINVYSTNYYPQMNGFMRGHNMPSDVDNLKEVLIQVVMANSGLNKISPIPVKAAIRTESTWQLENRIKMTQTTGDTTIEDEKSRVELGGGVTIEQGFISTAVPSETEGVAKGFENEPVKILYQNVIGKDISAISAFPEEREFLMPPTQVAWRRHAKEGSEDYFVARPVTTPQGLNERNQRMGKIELNSVELTLLGEKAENILKAVVNIKDDFDKQSKKRRIDPKRQQQLLELAAKANQLLSDNTLMPDQKLNEIDITLKSMHHEVQHEQSRFFGKSRLAKSIENIQKMMSSDITQSDADVAEKRASNIARLDEFYVDSFKDTKALQEYLEKNRNEIKNLTGEDRKIETELWLEHLSSWLQAAKTHANSDPDPRIDTGIKLLEQEIKELRNEYTQKMQFQFDSQKTKQKPMTAPNATPSSPEVSSQEPKKPKF